MQPAFDWAAGLLGTHALSPTLLFVSQAETRAIRGDGGVMSCIFLLKSYLFVHKPSNGGLEGYQVGKRVKHVMMLHWPHLKRSGLFFYMVNLQVMWSLSIKVNPRVVPTYLRRYTVSTWRRAHGHADHDIHKSTDLSSIDPYSR